MPGKFAMVSFPQPRAAVGAYSFLIAMGATLATERLINAAAAVPGEAAATASASSNASTFFDQVGVNADILLARGQMTLAQIYFDWVAPLAKHFSAIAALPENMASAVTSLNPFGQADLAISLGNSHYLISF